MGEAIIPPPKKKVFRHFHLAVSVFLLAELPTLRYDNVTLV
jgi:hypothetical protein